VGHLRRTGPVTESYRSDNALVPFLSPNVLHEMAAYKILVASNTSNVYTLSFEPDSASLKIISETEIGPQPSWIDFVSGLSDRRVIGGVHGKDGGVFIAQVDENTGRLDVLARANTGGGPCHVKAVGKGREIVAAHVCLHVELLQRRSHLCSR